MYFHKQMKRMGIFALHLEELLCLFLKADLAWEGGFPCAGICYLLPFTWEAEVESVARSNLKQTHFDAQVVKCSDSIIKPRGRIKLKLDL